MQFMKEPFASSKSLKPPTLLYVRERVGENIERAEAHYQNRTMSIPSNHFIMQLCKNLLDFTLAGGLQGEIEYIQKVTITKLKYQTMSRWLKSVNNLLENLDGQAESVVEQGTSAVLENAARIISTTQNHLNPFLFKKNRKYF